MNTVQSQKINYQELIHIIGKDFENRATQYDREGTFVFENYRQLKEHRYFSAAIPHELGGGGLSHAEMCHIIKDIAHYCSSTALAFSMHQHLVAAAVWKYKNRNEGASMLQNVAENQLVLVSTGARDWLGSNGELEKIEGGYLFSGKKHFASQSSGGDVAVTSATFLDTNGEWQVLHFAVPLNAEGVSLADDWDVMGMRATGSQTIIFNQVFIPDSSISLKRPKDEFHPIWDIVLTVALPLIMATYVGTAEKAMQIAVTIGRKYHRNADQMPYLIGKMNNNLLSAQTQWKAMYALTNNYDFSPKSDITDRILSFKTNIAEDTKQTVADAMDAIGGQSFYRSKVLERLFRDVQASPFHPLPKWEQYAFTGKRILSK